MNHFRIIITVILIFAISFVIMGNYVYADGVSSSLTTYWDSFCARLNDASSTSGGGDIAFLTKLIGQAIASTSANVCTVSSDGLHHNAAGTPCGYGSDSTGDYLKFKCDSCGEVFKYYVGDIDEFIGDYYNTYVSSLPASSVGSDGYLYWQPNWSAYTSNVAIGAFQYLGNSNTFSFLNNDTYNYSYGKVLGINASRGGICYSANVAFSSAKTVSYYYGDNYISVSAPVAGNYMSNSVAGNFNGISANYNLSWTTYHVGDRILLPSYNVLLNGLGALTSLNLILYAPIYKISPSSGLVNTQTDTNYNINTRVNNNTFNISTTNDNTGVYKENIQFVNETANTYYSVENNTYYGMSSWTYNYITRCYDITLTDGNTVSVAFGDDHITVIEQGNEHDYYYAVENTTSPTPAPTATPAPADPTDSNGWWSWLKTWLTDFKTWLGDKFDDLGANGKDTKITNNTYDYNVTYEDENGDSKSFSIKI